jgi:hypothetical protein
MNYNNSAIRLRNTSAPRPAELETAFSIETDKRGTHLRVRKVTTLLRRAMRPAAIATLGLAVAMCLASQANAQFNISASPGLFPSCFRGTISPFDDFGDHFLHVGSARSSRHVVSAFGLLGMMGRQRTENVA